MLTWANIWTIIYRPFLIRTVLVFPINAINETYKSSLNAKYLIQILFIKNGKSSQSICGVFVLVFKNAHRYHNNTHFKINQINLLSCLICFIYLTKNKRQIKFCFQMLCLFWMCHNSFYKAWSPNADYLRNTGTIKIWSYLLNG